MIIKTGTVIGNWKIISDRFREDCIWWHKCECICGNVKSVRRWHLNNNKSKSCGCTNVKGRFKSESVGDLSKSYYTSFKYNRFRKGFTWSNDLTIEYLWELFNKENGKCKLSGVKIELNPRWSQQNKGKITEIIQTASIDRINSSKNYTLDNVQWVHKDINFMKGKMKDIDFINMCRLVSKYN